MHTHVIAGRVHISQSQAMIRKSSEVTIPAEDSEVFLRRLFSLSSRGRRERGGSRAAPARRQGSFWV